MSTYEPGTVAVATVRGVPDVRVMAGHGTSEPILRWLTTDPRLVDSDNDGWYFDYQATDVRPLVVLDHEFPRTMVKHLRIAAEDNSALTTLAWLADQIEAQTKPPKPAEPTGLGAVVEDAEGEWWVQFSSKTGNWWRNHQGQHQRYADLTAVRVLSEGVTL